MRADSYIIMHNRMGNWSTQYCYSISCLTLFPCLFVALHSRYFPFNHVVRVVAFRSKLKLFSSKDDNFIFEEMGTFPPWVLDEEYERLYARAEALGCSRVCLSRRAATEEFILAKGATTGYPVNCIYVTMNNSKIIFYYN